MMVRKWYCLAYYVACGPGQFWDSSVLSCWLYIYSEPTHLLNITVSCTVLLVGTNIPRANHRSFHCRCSLFRVLYFILSTGLAIFLFWLHFMLITVFPVGLCFNGDILSVLSCVLKCFQNDSFDFVLSLGNFLVCFGKLISSFNFVILLKTVLQSRLKDLHLICNPLFIISMCSSWVMFVLLCVLCKQSC